MLIVFTIVLYGYCIVMYIFFSIVKFKIKKKINKNKNNKNNKKIKKNYFGLRLLHSFIGSKFSRHFFNQSEVKPKPIAAHACTFPRALCRLCVIT